MKIKILLIIFAMLCSTSFAAENGKEWLNPPNINDIHNANYPKINPKDIYEVVPTKVIAAINELKDINIQKITKEMAEWYTGHYYQCEKDKHPYLIRAVYGYGGTGKYELKKIEKSLLIIHGFLGKSNTYNKSALIVNLDFEPKEIFISVEIDE